MLYNSILECIGNTPLVRLSNIEKAFNLKAHLYAKIESFNPGGSVKDRVAYQIIKDGLKENKINKDTTLVEATSGNTGIGLALVCHYLKLKLVIVMPENMSIERRKAMSIYGASIILTPKEEGMLGAEKCAQDYIASHENCLLAGQFISSSNPSAHLITGEEIYRDLPSISMFIAGIGTGGTVTGVGTYLKAKDKNIKIIGIEPLSSPLIKLGHASSHLIQGIGANFVPQILNKDLLDDIYLVSDEDAYKGARVLLEEESIFAGISSGASLMGGIYYASKDEFKNKDIVILLPDTGSRYLSVKGLYNE